YCISLVFFFSSRRRHTRFSRDWSSDVCSSDLKIALFRSLFRGREDVYPQRFESRQTGRAGYSPACGNEWVRGICEKPRIKCSERSEEHTSELQSRENLVCRLLLEKKKKKIRTN